MSKDKKIIFKSSPYVIKNKNFSTIDFTLIFSCKYNKRYLFYLSLIKQIVLNTSFYYPTEEQYKKTCLELMIIKQSMFWKRYNENLFIKFNLTVPNPKKLNGYDLDSAFKFFVQTIYNPNVKDNKFNKDIFEREKAYLKNDILYSQKNIYSKAYQNFLNIVDDCGILKDNIYNNMDLIDSANEDELYEVYQELIINNKPIIVAYGDIDSMTINTLIKKYINIDNKKIIVEKNYYNFLKPYDKVMIKEEKSSYNQSILYVAYKVDKMTCSDKIYLNLIKNILAIGSNSLVFKSLRIDNGLVYDTSTWCNMYVGLLVIETYINNNSKDIIIKEIEMIIEKLKDITFLKKQIDRIIEDIKYSQIREQDNRLAKLNKFLMEKSDCGYALDVLIDKYKNIDINLLIDFIERLKLDTIYFLKGGFNEE